MNSNDPLVEDTSVEIKILESLYITNAGLILIAPYIARLFDTLELTSNGEFNQPEDVDTAIRVLQYLITGNETADEYQLALSKVLCGVKISKSLGLDQPLSEVQKNAVDSLLLAVIEHWKALGQTSIAGLRESFLQRDGVLLLKEKHWELNVQAKAFDMLLDQLPWSYSVTIMPWMALPLHAQWR
jgi:hypothetical protein